VELVLLVAVALVVGAHAKTVVHSSGSSHRSASAPTVVHEVTEAPSKYRVNAHMMDLTQNVMEIPEQSMPVRHSHTIPDLEEDEADPISRVIEIPEQSVDNHAPALHDLEARSRRVAKRTKVGKGVFDDREPSIRNRKAVPAPLPARLERRNAESRIPEERVMPVTTDAPRTGEAVVGSNVWGTAGQTLSQNLPQGFVNPQLMNRGDAPREVSRAAGKMQYDSDQNQDDGIKFSSGNLQINIKHNTAKNFLDASRVQVGTSLLGARSDSEGRVARFRVRFLSPFTRRPIVLVTTVPEGAEKQNDVGPHPDVFAASVSEIRLDHFIVNVVRVDSFPNNGWGQKLYLDWIAMEYNSDYPTATNSAPFLMTHPAVGDFEKASHSAHTPMITQEKEVEMSDWDN